MTTARLYCKGGNGSHWEGCADVHWDCRIVQLEAELARRDEIIARLKEDAEDKLQDAEDKLQDAQLKPKTVYTVTMYRYGNREWHSYVLGAFSSDSIAREWAAKEEDYRGGKYKAEIIRWRIDSPTDFLKEEL